MQRLVRSRVVRVLGVLALALVAVVAGTNGYVLARGSGATADVGRIRHAQVAIVPGALVDRDGRMSGMLADRVQGALDLWRAHRVDRILVSGDHLRRGYDEPDVMRDALVRHGVPAAAIFCDHAGSDTRATMVRAVRVFGVHSAVVATQGFHVDRALYLARAAGIDAQGLVTDLHRYGHQGTKSDLREILARPKSVVDTVDDDHVLLGPPHPITGDGRSTYAPTPPVPTR